MSYKPVLEEITNRIKELLPADATVTEVEFEGPEVAIYSGNPGVLVKDENLVKNLAKTLRKRIVIRSDPHVRMDTEETQTKVKEIISDKAGISAVEFDGVLGEVIIEAAKPGVVIGKAGENLRTIVAKTRWSPRVQRTPPIESNTIRAIRNILKTESAKRQEILRMVGRRIHRQILHKQDSVRVTALGGYREVGRSCTLIQTGESNLLFDCGVSVSANTPDHMFPKLNLPEFDIQRLDAAIVSHAHLDHCLPPETPVTMDNGVEIGIGQLTVGNRVQCVDWNTGKQTNGEIVSITRTRGHQVIQRTCLGASMTQISDAVSPTDKSHFKEIESSPNHRFFTYRSGELVELRADRLEVGDMLPVRENNSRCGTETVEDDILPIKAFDAECIMLQCGVMHLRNDGAITTTLGLEPCLNDWLDTPELHGTRQQVASLVDVLRLHAEKRKQFQDDCQDEFIRRNVDQDGILNTPQRTYSSSTSQSAVREQHSAQTLLLSSILPEYCDNLGRDEAISTLIADELTVLLRADVQWHPIVEIQSETNPYEELVDIEVAEHRNFIAKGIVVHNSGFIPYLFKYGFEGAIYTTAPTRDMMTMLHLDYLDIAEKEGKLKPYSQREIKDTVLHTIPLNYSVVTDITPDVRLTLHNAGHIVGSAIPHFHIGEGAFNMAFAQDFKLNRSRLLDGANIRFPRLEALFMEATYGKPGDVLRKRQDCERDLEGIINDTIGRGGKVLIPVLAVGRAQELQIIIESMMKRDLIPRVPIYTDGMIREATAITTVHPEYLSRNLRDRIFQEGQNPFLSEYFKQIASQEERVDILHGDPCIIMSTSGMLTGGPSVQYFQALASDAKHAIVFVSYQGRGTLGAKVQKGISQISIQGKGRQRMLSVKMDVHSISGFTGHSDRKELCEYVRRVTPRPQKYLFMHGEESKCLAMASQAHRMTKKETLAPKVGSTTVLM